MDKTQITLSQAMEGYAIAAHARRLSPATLADYDNAFRKFETFLGRDPPLADITADDVRAFLGSLTHLSAKTLLNHHTSLSALWTWAVREGIARRHIVRDVERPKPNQPEIVPYTEQDIKAMLGAIDLSQAYVRPGKRRCQHSRPTALRDRAIMFVLIDTGVRASELCQLRMPQVDLKNRRLIVTGKGSKQRVLPITAATAQAIWRYLATRDDQRQRTFLFTSRTGRPIDRYNLRHIISRIGKRAGVKAVTLHRFRHTFAIEFLRNGGSIYALQRLLGHSTLETVKTYLSLAQADIERAHRDASPVTHWLL
jgi:integrase/recombinase XerD